MDVRYIWIITLIPDSFSWTIRLIKGGMIMANDNIINIDMNPIKNARSSDLYSGYGISCVAVTWNRKNCVLVLYNEGYARNNVFNQ